MITKKQVINTLFAKLEESLKVEGFKYIKAKQHLVRNQPLGFDSISFRVIDYWPLAQNIEHPTLSIRLNQVENIINRFFDESMFNPKFAKDTTTFHKSLRFKNLDPKIDDIEIKEETDLNKVIEEAESLIKNEGLLFFNENNSLEKINVQKKEKILTDDTGTAHILRNLMQSLTLMKLCNDSDFDELSEKYKELYVPWVGQEETGRKALDSLINHLKTI